ncbi:MAG: S41 family peptidase [Flavobacteriales bacterium]
MKQGFIKVYHLPIYLAITLVIGIFLGKNFFSSKSSFVAADSNDSLYTEALNLAEILKLVHENYVDSVNVKDIAHKGISEFLHQLDPHSNYIPSSKVDKANESLEGSFEGIGLEFLLVKDTIVSVRPVKNGPSAIAGIQPGDKIVIIEGKNASHPKMKSEEVVGKLRGKRGSVVNVKVKRSGVDSLIPFAITRAEIPIYSVDAAFMLDSSTAYFKIGEFSRTTMDEFKATYPYNNNKVKTVVMDLRGNGGGYLNTCTQLVDEFLKDGELIVYTQDRQREQNKMYASSVGKFEEVKLYVLIDHQSASASEIFAGAMQDNDRATIIGSRSFGKGLVQELFTLSDGSQVRLTVSRYYTPSGRCIQKPYKDVDYLDYAYSDNDSVADTTAYYTKSKRKVFGGGGIHPDINIKEDSMVFWRELTHLYQDDFARKCAIQAIVQNAAQWKSLTAEQFINNNKAEEAMRKTMGALLPKALSTESKNYLLNDVKGNVLRCLWGNNAYYQYKLRDDRCLMKIK